MDEKDDLPVDYIDTVREIKERIRSSQYSALREVNKELIALYWDIGRIIVEKQEGDVSWGESTVDHLSTDLQLEFPGIKGFSRRNLFNMRKFYLQYKDNEKVQALTAQISWTSNLVIIEKCQNDLEREFYLRMSRKHGWPYRVLESKIRERAYERTIANQTNFNRTLPPHIGGEARLSVKDEYTFDFLGMGQEYSERELEDAILREIPTFLKEMGGSIAFISNQFRLVVDDQEFFIDLLLYHRDLECLIAIELKTGDFRPEYVGKMQFYLEALDRRVRKSNENPSIGIILCKSKKRTVVEYTLARSMTPIGVSEYRTVAKLPRDLEKMLPSKEQIGRLLGSLD